MCDSERQAECDRQSVTVRKGKGLQESMYPASSSSPSSDCEILGAVDVIDSRFSSVDLMRNWSLGFVVRKSAFAFALVANAKAEIGVGVALTLPKADLQLGN